MVSTLSRIDLLNNMLCRLCAREDLRSISIFGDEGKRQNIVKKIQICLPVANVREDDNYPKQICLTCLTKLDSFWEMYVSCKEAQTKIQTKFYILRQENNSQLVRTVPPIEHKLKNLSETSPVLYGDSAVICLAPDNPPSTVPSVPQAAVTPFQREAHGMPQPVSAGPVVEPVVTPIAYLAPAPAPAAVPSAPLPVTEEVYPECLIQVSQNPATEPPVVYQNRTVPVAAQATSSAPAPAPARRRNSLVPVPKPMNSVTNSRQQTAPTPTKRQHGDVASDSGPQAKKLCCYCNKYFPDDIIDHHKGLHLRQSFLTCIDCDKNFRSEDALKRHRCEIKETISIDEEDETIVL